MISVAGIDESDFRWLVKMLYDRVRSNAELPRSFNDAVAHWPAHSEKLASFWSSGMLTSGRYKGQPVSAHLKHKDRITQALLDRQSVSQSASRTAGAAVPLARSAQP